LWSSNNMGNVVTDTEPSKCHTSTLKTQSIPHQFFKINYLNANVSPIIITHSGL